MLSMKKKTFVYLVFAVLVGYACIHVAFFNEAYSPLQVLADAHSEAKRLLRFMTLYHFQCNNTHRISNNTNWPICTEQDGGINVESKTPKIIYSIGTTDYEFEELLARNLTSKIYLFSHKVAPTEFMLNKANNTYYFKKTIVPNEPSDFSRNSFESQTINSVMTKLHHSHVDILKIETLMDSGQACDVLYYLIKDKVLSKVKQLHFTIRIDKIDDDYLYSWYRTLYNLFHDVGFRLYHTAASNQLCLQVTLMESCVYYMSWINSPSPKMFVMFPPAVDGTYDNELKRFKDHLKGEKSDCSFPEEVQVTNHQPLSICLDVTKYTKYKPCHHIILRTKRSEISVTSTDSFKCKMVVVQGTDMGMDGEVTVFLKDSKGSLITDVQTLPLTEAMDKYLTPATHNYLYIDSKEEFWELLTLLLDNGYLRHVDQMIAEVDLWNKLLPHNIRRHYSELMRTDSYGLHLYQFTNLYDDNTFHFRSNTIQCCQRLNYIRMVNQ